ncbi:MFS transporter [Lachnospiraceae bacterium 29-91]
MKPKIDLQKASTAEKIWYALGNTGVQLVNILVMSYITLYYTNNVGIAAATAGTIMMLAKLTDGISDIIFSVIMERTHFKMGKARPWLLISGPLMGVSVILVFNVPITLSATGKIAYTFLTYTFMQAIAITVFWLAYNSLFPLISHDPQDRNVIQSIGSFCAYGAGMLITFLVPFAFAAWGGMTEPGCWSKISIIIAVSTTIVIVISAFVCQEKDDSDLIDEKNETGSYEIAEKKEKTLEIAKIVFSQKRTWLVLFVFFGYDCFMGMSALKTYICLYALGDTNMSFYGSASRVSTILTMFISLAIPLLFKKLGRRNSMIVGAIISGVGFIGLFLFGTSKTGYLICNLLSVLGALPMMIGRFTYVSDLTDAIIKKYKINAASFCAVCGSFGTKLGTGIGSALVGWMLAWIGFDAAAQMSSATLKGLFGCATIVPLVIEICTLIFCLAIERISKNNAVETA